MSLNLKINKSFLRLIVVSVLILIIISSLLLTGYHLGREVERRAFPLKASKQISPTAPSLQESEKCVDSKFINNTHQGVKFRGTSGLFVAHCDGLVFTEFKPSGEESKYIYSVPEKCHIVSSLMSPSNEVLAFYLGEYPPRYGDYPENRCQERGLYFFDLKSESLIKGPSVGTFLVPRFWSSDSKKVYCELDRPFGEGCEPMRVVSMDDREIQKTPICGEFFQNESDPDEIIHLTSSEDAPAPCLGIKIKNQISRFNAQTEENNVIFQSKDKQNMTILEVFNKNQYLLIEKTKGLGCVNPGPPSYLIFDTITRTIRNI